MESILLNKNIIDSLISYINTIPSREPELFCKQCKEASLFLPEEIKQKLFTFAEKGSSSGCLIIKCMDMDTNVDVDIENKIMTPDTNCQKIGEQTTLAKIQGVLISLISEMIAYEAEGYGCLFQDIVPIKEMEKKQTSVGSQIELEIHTEQAFSTLRPDILSLACIRGDISAFTYILPLQYVLQQLSEEETNMLWKPLWKIGIDLSFKLNLTKSTSESFIDGEIRGPIPILSGDKKDPHFVFDQDLMIGMTPESEKIIQKIVDIYHQYRISHNLVSGEIIFIDNRRAVHGRSPFVPRYDGHDRFLIRCFSVFDYEKSKYARHNNNRVISSIYS